jgi:hypothetical protein
VDGDKGVLASGGKYEQKKNFRPHVVDVRK